MKNTLFCYIGILCSIWILGTANVKAIGFSESIARYYTIESGNTKPQNGNIIVMGADNIMRLSDKEYDPLVAGVIVNEPAISLKPANQDSGKYPVMSSDQALVLVDISKGQIMKGDYITTSSKPGMGMKADKIGFVIGIAIVDSTATTETEGYVLTDLKLEASSQIASIGQSNWTIKDNIGRLLSVSSLAMTQQPSAIFKYIMAGLVIIISLILSATTFMKLAYNSVEALGRNPLGTNAILFGTVINGLLGVLVVVGGFGLSYLLLTM